jgi:hypothetical protein
VIGLILGHKTQAFAKVANKPKNKLDKLKQLKEAAIIRKINEKVSF